MAEQIELRDGGTLGYERAFFEAPEADALFAWLRDNIPWQREGGRGRPFPRLTAYCADAGTDYAYSGVTHRGEGWPAELLEVRRRVEHVSHAEFNSLLLNRYRDGRDSIGMHADDEPELGTNPVVGSISLGAVRTFVMRHRTSREKMVLELAHGSLLVMAGTCQHFWLHGVPKTEKPVGERINLTFRNIKRPG